MADLVTLEFDNRDSGEKASMKVEPSATSQIAEWYGAYHGGDDYDVSIDGEMVEKDINGRI